MRRPLLKLRPIPDAAVRRRGHTVTLTLAELRTVSAIVDEWIAGTRLDARTARSALRKLAAAGGTTYRGAE